MFVYFRFQNKIFITNFPLNIRFHLNVNRTSEVAPFLGFPANIYLFKVTIEALEKGV